MAQISLRPEFAIRGGEACGIMLDDQYVGTLMMLYREEDRLLGSVQLDKEMLTNDEKEDIDTFIHDHIENLLDALAVPECFVTLTYSEYDHIVMTEDVEARRQWQEERVHAAEDRVLLAEDWLVDEQVKSEEDEEPFQLIIVGEARNRVEYHIQNVDGEWVADALLRITRGNVTGEIVWQYSPAEEEMDALIQLLVSDFHSDEVDTFTLAMYDDDEELAIVELTHEDVADMDLASEEMLNAAEHGDHQVEILEDEDVSLYFELMREELDVLIYDVYEEQHSRSVRIGTATIDVATEEVTCLLEMIQPRDRHLREQIAYHIIDMLEEDFVFETFTVTMQYMDDIIDEYMFDAHEQPEGIYPSYTHENISGAYRKRNQQIQQ